MLKKIYKYLKIIFYRLVTNQIVRNFKNRKYIKSYNIEKRKVSNFDLLFLKKISVTGYCKFNLHDFFDNNEIKEINERALRIYNILLNAKKNLKHKSISDKNYLIRLLDIDKYICFDDPLVNSVLKGKLHHMAKNYLMQDVKLVTVDYWLNFPNPNNNSPFASQVWHRDYEDKQLLKIFLYFTDVEEGNGPFYYISKTHICGEHNLKFKATPPFGITIPEEKIQENFNTSVIKKFKMKKGEMLLVDTAGIHKGGHCTLGERFVFTATFTTFAGISKRNYKFKENLISKFPSSSIKSLTN